MVKRRFELATISSQYVRAGKISRADAVRLLAEIVKKSREVVYVARDRVSHQLSYAVKRGALKAPDAEGFLFDDLIAWAQSVYSEKMRRAGVPRQFRGSVDAEYFLPGEGVLPLDLTACHADLIRLNREVLVLRRQNAELASELKRCLEKKNQMSNAGKINAVKRWSTKNKLGEK